MTPKKIYFVAGEVSGDHHGAALMCSLRQLAPELQFLGRGGPQMQALAGNQFHNWIHDSAVVGLWEVIRKYGYFRKQFRQTLAEISEAQPDAIVLIDYPGFNLRLGRALPGRGIAAKIIYYISPQVWAWNRGRIEQMSRWIDLMLCIFPFEGELYDQSGLRTRFVGHPMIERLQALKTDAARDPDLIGLFPGSRRREVRKIFPILVAVATRLRQTQPRVRFEVAAASRDLASEMEAMLKQQPETVPDFQITIGDSAGIMQHAWVGIVASGSATLEAAYFRMPFVLVYKVSWLTYLAARFLVRVKYLGMPNLLAGREIVPEFIQHRANANMLADVVGRLQSDSARREQMIVDLDAVVAGLGPGGASDDAARAIVEELGESH
jgi:lipid-A-disaccharide synthase